MDTKAFLIMALDEGPKTLYDLSVKEKVAPTATTLKYLAQLLEEGIVTSNSYKQGNRRKKPYSLTNKGLQFSKLLKQLRDMDYFSYEEEASEG